MNRFQQYQPRNFAGWRYPMSICPTSNINISIPPRLHGLVRFIKIASRGKNAIEKNFLSTKNYSHDDPILIQHLESGGNYGVLGSNSLVIIDLDNETLVTHAEPLLPPTFTVLSGSGRGPHRYYRVIGNKGKNVTLVNPQKPDENWGNIQAAGKYVVGPGSIHPSGGSYTVINDIPVTEIAFEELERIFSQFIRVKREINEDDIRRHYGLYSDVFTTITLNDVGCYPVNPIDRGNGEIQGAHPIHGSEGGMNFAINTHKNTFHCFPEGTLVDTPIGLAPIENIKPGDVVYGKNGQYNSVTCTFNRKYTGKLFEIKTGLQEIRVTEGHPILIARCKKCKKEYEPYIACKPNCPRLRKDGKHNCSADPTPEIKWENVEHINPETDFVILPRNETIGEIQFDLKKYRKLGNYKIKTPETIPLNKETAKIFGLYVAEGHVSNGGLQGYKIKKRYLSRVQFTFGIKEEDLAIELKNLIEKWFGVRVQISRYPNRSTILVQFGSTIVARFLHDVFGNGANKKQFGVCLHAKPEILEVLYEYYFKGDGNLRTIVGEMGTRSISKKLTEEVQILLFNLNIHNNSYLSKEHVSYQKNGNKLNNSDIYTVKYPKNRKQVFSWQDKNKNWYIPIKSVDWSEFSGVVYNIETEDHTYQIPFVVHNCYRHESGGGPLEWLAISEGIIDCADAGPGCLRGDKFKAVLEIAKERGFKISLPKKLPPRRPKILTDETTPPPRPPTPTPAEHTCEQNSSYEDVEDYFSQSEQIVDPEPPIDHAPVGEPRITVLEAIPDQIPDADILLLDAPPRLGKTHRVVTWAASLYHTANMITTSHSIVEQQLRIFRENKNAWSTAVHLEGKDRCCIKKDQDSCKLCEYYPFDGENFLDIRQYVKDQLNDKKILTKENVNKNTGVMYCPYYILRHAEPFADYCFTVVANLDKVSKRECTFIDEDPAIDHFFANSVDLIDASFHQSSASATSKLEERWKGIEKYKEYLENHRHEGRKFLLRAIEILEQFRAILNVENMTRETKQSLIEQLNAIDTTLPELTIEPYKLIDHVKRFELPDTFSPYVEALIYQYTPKKFIWSGSNPTTLHMVAVADQLTRPIPEGKIVVIGSTRAELFVRAVHQTYNRSYKVIRIPNFPYSEWFAFLVVREETTRSGKRLIEQVLKKSSRTNELYRYPMLVLTGSEKHQRRLKSILGGIAHSSSDENRIGQLWNKRGGFINIFYQNSVISRGIDVDFYNMMVLYTSDFATPYWSARLEVARENHDVDDAEFARSIIDAITVDETTNSVLRISPVRTTQDSLVRIVILTDNDLWKIKPDVIAGSLLKPVDADFFDTPRWEQILETRRLGLHDIWQDPSDPAVIAQGLHELRPPNLSQFERMITGSTELAPREWRRNHNPAHLTHIEGEIRKRLQHGQAHGSRISEIALVNYVVRRKSSRDKRLEDAFTPETILRILQDMVRSGEIIREYENNRSMLSLRERYVPPDIGNSDQFDV